MRILTGAVNSMAVDENASEVAVHGIDPIIRAEFPLIAVNRSMARLVYAIGINNVSSMEVLDRVS